jgi:PhoPQ-activated pathogenicity-related protein
MLGFALFPRCFFARRPVFRLAAQQRLAVALVLLASLGLAQQPRRTPLDVYVHAPDSAYEFHLVKTLPGEGNAAFVLEMTSQSWRQPSEVDRTAWKHWLMIYRPAEVAHSTALLFIGGGRNDGKAPEEANPDFSNIAKVTKSVVAELRMVPNQPLTFAGDDFGPRVEDELIAYNWRRYLDSGDVQWLTRLPMTKSAVRAMDTITAFLAGEQGGSHKVDRFVVAGGSKRGWTTWTTAAVDDRVVGIVPIVIDLLNIKPSFIHHYRVYGFWAPAVEDYFREGIMDRMNDPRFEELLSIVGPYSYRERYTMPKLVLNSAGDQFFLPDSSQFYFDKLPGEKHLRYVPNSDHSLRKTDAMQSLIAFYHALLMDTARPEFSWRFEADGVVRVETSKDPSSRPSAVKLWKATNPRHRDFRLESVGPIYASASVEPESEGVYVARVPEPESGWTAFFLELTFPSGLEKFPFKFTTPVRVVPDRYPYPEPVPGKTRIGPQKQ